MSLALFLVGVLTAATLRASAGGRDRVGDTAVAGLPGYLARERDRLADTARQVAEDRSAWATGADPAQSATTAVGTPDTTVPDAGTPDTPTMYPDPNYPGPEPTPSDVGVADLDHLRALAGLAPVRGPAVTVELDDAPRERRGMPFPAGVPSPGPDDLVVHQQDVQAVVNALWAGGAEAMSIMGERVTARTSVRCVGNTLLLHSEVYSPPFRISAVGDPAALRSALDGDPGVALYRDYVDAYGLGYQVSTDEDLLLPS